MSFFIFSPDGKDFCQFMTPNFPKPMFLTHFHLRLVGIFFSIPTWHLALGQWSWPWPWDRPNLDQGWGSTWTRHGAQPRPPWPTELATEAQAEPRAWSTLGTGFVAHLGSIWGPIFVWVPFGVPFLCGAHLGPICGPFWRPKADITGGRSFVFVFPPQ